MGRGRVLHTDHSNFGPLTGKGSIPESATILPSWFFRHLKPSKQDGSVLIHTQTMFKIQVTDFI